MRSHSQTARARIRRMQLTHIDMTDRNKLDQIVETPIATVEATRHTR
jgi:hypothetical protein